MSEVIHYEQRNDVALIRIDDGKANAMTQTLIDDVHRAFNRASSEAKAIVLLGRPERFSAGFDLKVMKAGADAARALVLAGGELFMRVYEHPQPVVIGCTGHAIAGGVLLLATGDVRIGVRGDFKLGLNEVANGMPVPILGHALARDRLDPRAVEKAVLHAHLASPEEALSMGWIDQLEDAGRLEEVAVTRAAELAKLGQPAYGLTKRSLRERTIRYVRSTMNENLLEFRVG